MKNPKISVVVPIFNREEFLDKCICSIQKQSYTNLEIILVNDGSTDNSINICNKFAENDRRIIIIDKENGGVSSARNCGLDIASGDYIGFVDSDDYIDKEMYRLLIETSLKNDADIAECGYNLVDEKYIIISSFPLNSNIINGNYECSKAFLQGENTTHSNANKLYRKTLFEIIRFPEYKFGEDYWVNAKTSYFIKRKVTIEGCYYYYVSHKKSVLNSPFNKDSLDMVLAGKNIYEFYKTRFTDLSPYVALYIIENILRLYKEVKRLFPKGRQKIYLKKLIDEFKDYYTFVEGEAYENIKFKTRHIALILFKANPDLYCLFSKLYQKIKYNF